MGVGAEAMPGSRESLASGAEYPQPQSTPSHGHWVGTKVLRDGPVTD